MTESSLPARSSATPAVSLSSRLFWWIAVCLLTLLAGWGVAHGPVALRRPWLTSSLMGLGLGAIARWLAGPTQTPLTGLCRTVVAIAAASSVLLLHVEQFRILRQTVLAQPSQLRMLIPGAGIEDLLEQADVTESQRRQYRLATSPTFSDYLAQRAELLFGITAAPMAWWGLFGEAGLGALAAVWGWRWAGSNQPRAVDA
ncbi:MAG: hypothetical protein ACK5Q5_08500 [Planctomycetaceae bacterium]